MDDERKEVGRTFHDNKRYQTTMVKIEYYYRLKYDFITLIMILIVLKISFKKYL